MSTQRFYANPRRPFTWPNGAVGYRPCTVEVDILGPYAKVHNCPIEVRGLCLDEPERAVRTDIRLTCYATNYGDTFFSVPACTRFKGKHVAGFFTNREDGVVFVPMEKFQWQFVEAQVAMDSR